MYYFDPSKNIPKDSSESVEDVLMEEMGLSSWTEVHKIKGLLDDNREVYYGEFEDQASVMELFLCLYSMLIHTDDIYLNFSASSY
jgi:hypothetical protein